MLHSAANAGFRLGSCCLYGALCHSLHKRKSAQVNFSRRQESVGWHAHTGVGLALRRGLTGCHLTLPQPLFSQACFPPRWRPSQAELPFEGTSWPRRHPHSSQPGRRMSPFPHGFQPSPQFRLSLGHPGALRLWKARPAKESDDRRSRRDRYHEN